MLDEKRLLDSLRDAPEKELERFKDFLNSHTLKQAHHKGQTLDYYCCGKGKKTILTLAGGWGGPELLYDTILGFEKQNTLLAVDISCYADPDLMSEGINHILDIEKIKQVVLLGQSASGITAQSYFKRNPERVEGLVLTNTLAPRIERCKKWALVLLKVLPISLMKSLAKRKLSKLSEFEQEISLEVKERRRFAAALLGAMMDLYITKQNVTNFLKLAFAFNEKDAYTAGEFKDWEGRVLLVTSEDESYYPDVALLEKGLPHSEVFKLPTGFGHVAPQILRDEFHSRIRSFIDGLGG